MVEDAIAHGFGSTSQAVAAIARNGFARVHEYSQRIEDQLSCAETGPDDRSRRIHTQGMVRGASEIARQSREGEENGPSS